ncbi:hypothetical protein F4813DRAFT_345177 [Daldinia decipiens]|uniref:uncharacterized protein n=1 Tax=Daldinia decipiens TaxID=326647 RepID=UPI0020C1BE03|nr:uncharacterized protein F4813DRAFT_345177 [Daldinia decipiens]KAI1661644.1 hypothetical protein F4813DRAFT_345177 [Daldinia decipiens]
MLGCFVLKKGYFEDFLVTSALAIYIAYNCCIYRIIDVLGMFVHQWETPIQSLTKFLWFACLTEIFYVIIVVCLKISILLDWIHIFVPTGTRNVFFWTCHILLWLNLLFYFTCLIAFNLACFPHKKIWDKTIEGGWCLDPWVMLLSTGILNLISDFIILLAPQWVIWNLKMPLRRKLAISLAFATGIFCVVFAGFRIASSATYLNSFDVVYDGSAMLLWAEGEMTLLFFVVCLPSTPKAISGVKSMDMSWISRIWASSSANTKGTGESNSWPRLSSASRNHRSYKKVDEYRLGPLSGFQKAQVPYRVPTTENADWSTGIVRTTEFATME